MIRIIYYVATSLDGFIAAENGSVDWLDDFNSAAEDYGYGEFFESVDAMLLGSITYEQVLGFGDWPYGSKACYVLSQRSLKSVRPEVVITPQNPTEVVTDLEEKGHQRIWLVGGARVAAAFQRQHLITDYMVSVIPVVVGSGIPMLFPQGRSERLQLVKHRCFPNGVINLHYTQAEDA